MAEAGQRSLLAVPLLLEQRIMGCLVVWRQEEGLFPERIVKLLQTFATQSTLAIQNAQLFREIEARGRFGDRQSTQVAIPGQYEPRTAHPDECHFGYTELIINNKLW